MKQARRILCGLLMIAVALSGVIAGDHVASACRGLDDGYKEWKSFGAKAADQALAMIKKSTKKSPDPRHLIVLSNAGYAEVLDQTTLAALDGLSEVTKASRGAGTLVEVHSAPRAPLWFAVYDKKSGICAYLQVDPTRIGDKGKDSELFSTRSTARIDYKYLKDTSTYAPGPPPVFTDNFPKAPTFGGNEFRIVTIANGVAEAVPAYVLRSFEFHDHYCPGVTSGIIMANYAKAAFSPTETESWYVQGLQPWCKEDALMVMLNATPGKSGYGVTYSTPAHRTANWGDASNAASIIFHKDELAPQWEGVVLGFTFPTSAQTGCDVYTGNLNKLCTDLWALDHLNDGSLLTLYKKFKLPEGKHPKDFAAPGADPMIPIMGLPSIP